MAAEYPPAHPVPWLVSYGTREVEIVVQSWYAARVLGAAELGVDVALVHAVRKSVDEDAERVDASMGRCA